ncbi:hypothetical protein GCM10022216_20040 [Sphingobacterium kyonggiense]|uniref:Immunity protein 30 of polymorphic toxin system n=2 Tax=Sphingobacterium kyonggiense TaxID=714075 RepID=A0ABP7YSQ7_9SPHI
MSPLKWGYRGLLYSTKNKLYMEITTNNSEAFNLTDKMREVVLNCFTSDNNLENLDESQQMEIYTLFEKIKYKDIIDQSFWSLGGGLSHYYLSLNEIKLSLLEIMSTRSDDKERLILKEIFLFLNILDDRSFYQLIAIRQLLNCPNNIFSEKLEEVKLAYFE